MLAARRLTVARPVAVRRLFHGSAPARVQVGDKIPDVDLMEGSPGNRVNLASALKGKGVIIGVPAAFSPSCSESHIPGYIHSAKLKDAGSVFVVSFTSALDLSFDGKAIFGNARSKRYALVVEDGVVKEAHVEPDNTGLNVSAADKVL